MPRNQFGVTLQGVEEPDAFRETVWMIEKKGFSHLWLTDSSLHARCVYSYLTLAALTSQTLKLGTAVTHPFTRHPGINVNSVATIDEISNRRMALGIGAGDNPTEELGFRPANVATVRAMLEAARCLLSGDTITLETDAFSFREARIHWSAQRAIPIYVACSGPKMLEMAGQYADGALVLCGAFPKAIEFALERLAKGAAKAGRRLEDVDVWFMLYGSLKLDREQAYEESRALAAWFAFRAPHYCELAGVSKSLIDGIRNAYSGGEFHLASEAARLTTDDMVRMLTLGGTPEEVQQRVSSLINQGVKSVNFFPIGTERLKSIELFATHVMPN